MKNRLQRREYERQIKKDKRASICPKCGYKSLFYSTQVPTGEFDVETKEDGTTTTIARKTTGIKCEVCDQIIYMGEDVAKLIPPGVILPLPLDIFDYALRNPDILAGNTTEVENTN